jgi:hypothetical protein
MEGGVSDRPSGGLNSLCATCLGDVNGDVSGEGRSRTPWEELGDRMPGDPDTERRLPKEMENV